MKCTKCGSDAVMKDGDWLTCLNCGNVMFDTRRPEETAAEISPTKLLEQMEAGTLQRIPQTGETCYVGTLKKSMGEMDWSRPAEELERQVRGLNPWPSAYTFLNGKTLKIWKAEVLHTEAVSSQEAEEPEALADRKSCGSVIVISRDSIQVQTGDGILAIRELQLEGKKRMTADAFLRGYPVEAGTILGRTAEE